MLLAPSLRKTRGNASVVTRSAQRWRRVAVTEDKVPKGNANREENGLDMGWIRRQFLVGGLEHDFYFSIIYGNNHPNWLSYFLEG